MSEEARTKAVPQKESEFKGIALKQRQAQYLGMKEMPHLYAN